MTAQQSHNFAARNQKRKEMSIANNFTVEGLVAKYRNYVNENCPKEYCPGEYKDENGKWHINDSYIPFSPDGNADEQLISTIYKVVATENADTKIVDALSEYLEKYYKAALTEEEVAFLCNHFSEFVTYEFEHRKDWLFHSGMNLSKERVRLVHEYVKPQEGATVFIADAEYCDLAVQFPSCIIEGFTGFNYKQKRVWALGQIRMYAAGIKSEIVSGEEIDGKYEYTLPEKGSVDFVIFRVNENKYFAQQIFGTECNNVESLYDLLKPGGKMLIFSEFKSEMAGNEKTKGFDFSRFRKRLVEEKAISSIISYEDTAILGKDRMNYILLVISKSPNSTVCIRDEKKHFSKVIGSEVLDSDILWPSYYMVNRPSEGRPLSSIVELVAEKEVAEFIEGQGFVLPDKAKGMVLMLRNAYGESFKDANLFYKSGYYVDDPAFTEKDWVNFLLAEQPCVLLSGNTEKLVVGYTTYIPQNGFVYAAGCQLVPQKGYDVRYIAALLFKPSVRDQITTICDGDVNQRILSLVLEKIIVPDHDEKERLRFLVEAMDDAMVSSKKEMETTFEEKLASMKADYINEVRMRKHDMRPHLRQLASAERLMLHYIETNSDIDELKEHLKSQIGYVHKALGCISDIVDHLSDEEKYGNAEIVNIDKFLEEIEISHNDSEGFTIEYDCDHEAFRKRGFAIPDLTEQWEKAQEQGIDMKDFILARAKDNLPLFVEIAHVDFQRMVDNIIENARKHGFTDSSRKDYFIGVDLSLNMEGNMYQIDFNNNGNPLPDGMTKERFGIRGEKAGLTGGTGSGGYIIKSIVTHYGGDYDVFTKDGVTTIRIYLPIAKKI
jgi:signal transduction histidine kinase